MSAEIDSRAFFDSDFYKKDYSHLAWVESRAESIVEEFAWKPVIVHVTEGFSYYVYEQTKRGELPPYYGILNTFDEEGNFTLFPWFRTKDVRDLITKSLSRTPDIDEALNAFVSPLDPANLIKHCDHRLIIPRSELVTIAWDPQDKYK